MSWEPKQEINWCIPIAIMRQVQKEDEKGWASEVEEVWEASVERDVRPAEIFRHTPLRRLTSILMP